MLKRDELKGPICLTSAADDEPIFVLKSTDELAPGIVREWAAQYKASKQAQVGGWTERQQAKYEEACLLATKMLRWQQERMAGSSEWAKVRKYIERNILPKRSDNQKGDV